MQQFSNQKNKKVTENDLDWGIILALLLFMMIGLSSLFQAAMHMHGATLASALRPVAIQGVFLDYWGCVDCILGTV